MEEQPVSRPLWRKQRSVFTLALLATLFTAMYKVMDNINLKNFVVAEDALTAVLAYFVFAGWLGVICFLIFALTFGKKLVDPEFARLSFRGESKNMQLFAFLSGAIAAGGTLFNLWANKYIDPATAIALGSMIIVYTCFYDVLAKEVRLASIILPAVLVTIGGMLSSYSGPLQFSLAGLLLMGLLSNGLFAVSEVTEQKGVRQTDGVNFTFWRFFWLATIGTIIAIVVSLVRGNFSVLTSTISNASRYFPFFILTMLFVFLGIGLKLTAKKRGAISVVLMVLTGQIVLGYLLTFIGNAIVPGLFGALPGVSVWIVRSFGSILLIGGIFILRKKT